MYESSTFKMASRTQSFYDDDGDDDLPLIETTKPSEIDFDQELGYLSSAVQRLHQTAHVINDEINSQNNLIPELNTETLSLQSKLTRTKFKLESFTSENLSFKSQLCAICFLSCCLILLVMGIFIL